MRGWKRRERLGEGLVDGCWKTITEGCVKKVDEEDEEEEE